MEYGNVGFQKLHRVQVQEEDTGTRMAFLPHEGRDVREMFKTADVKW